MRMLRLYPIVSRFSNVSSMIAVKTDAFESNRMIEANAERCAETQIAATFYEVVRSRPKTWIRKRRNRRRNGPTFERRRAAREWAGRATLVLKSADLGSGRFEREIELRPEGLGACICELFLADQLDLCYGRVRGKGDRNETERSRSARLREASSQIIWRLVGGGSEILLSRWDLGVSVRLFARCSSLFSCRSAISGSGVLTPICSIGADWVDSVGALTSPRSSCSSGSEWGVGDSATDDELDMVLRSGLTTRGVRSGLQRFGVMRNESRLGQLRLARRIVDFEWVRREYGLGCEPVRNEKRSGPETLEVRSLLDSIGEGDVVVFL